MNETILSSSGPGVHDPGAGEIPAGLRLVPDPAVTAADLRAIRDEIVHGPIDLDPCRVTVVEVVATGRRILLLTKYPRRPSAAAVRAAYLAAAPEGGAA